MISQQIAYKIDKCRPINGKRCKSEQEIADFVYDLEVNMWVIQEKYDEDLFDFHTRAIHRPTYRENRLVDRYLGNTNFKTIYSTYLGQNNVETWDNPFNIAKATLEDTWYTIFNKHMHFQVKELGPTIFEQKYWLNNFGTKYNREVYNFLDLLGDLGGVMEVIDVIIGFFLLSISEFSYNLEVMSKLFFARTKDDNLLLAPNLDEEMKIKSLNSLSRKANKELLMHRAIKLKPCD